MVNQVGNLGSTKWDDHEMVKVILRSLVFRNPTQVKLIRGDPRYKQMSPEEVIGKFVSFELMIKDSKHIVNLEHIQVTVIGMTTRKGRRRWRRRDITRRRVAKHTWGGNETPTRAPPMRTPSTSLSTRDFSSLTSTTNA
jgi:hypothetical protein